MNSTFFGLELSRRALEAQQTALDITGHNVANANTAGYTRQIANLQATTPDSLLSMGHNLSLGTGVSLDSITRARDAFVDKQYRLESSKQSYWGSQQDSLSKVQDMFNEPSDDSISNDLNNFWSAWSDLSKDPENMGARSVVRERALALTDSFHHVSQQLTDMQNGLDANVRVQIDQVNTYARQIKDLNDQIKRAEVAGDNPNDLKDQRDTLIDQLSQIVNVKVIEQKDPKFTDRNVNSYTVVIGNESISPPQTLVADSAVYQLQTPAPANANGLPYATVTWANGPNAGQTLDLGSSVGSLKSNLDIRGDQNGQGGYLDNLMQQFNQLAQGIADAVNALHQTGQGLTAENTAIVAPTPPDVLPTSYQVGQPIGIDFFTDGSSSPSTTPPFLPKVTAANITLNSVIDSDLSRIATGIIPTDPGSPPTHSVDTSVSPSTLLVNVGDGSLAAQIATMATGWSALQSQIASGNFGVDTNGNNQNPVSAASLSDFYGATIAQMGVDVQQATRMNNGEDVLVTHLSNQRDSYSGVSLDEEMTNMVKFQKSYAAAARMVTMMDDMLNTIVNGMGVTR